MLVYVYDGSFEGLLTSIYEAYYRRERPDKIMSENLLELNIMESYVHIKTGTEKSDRVYNSALEKISPEAVENIFYVYLSEDKNAGTTIYNYMRLGFKVGSSVDKYLSEEHVFNTLKISQRVSFETHRMEGLLRFKKLRGEIYYAQYEPDNNITMLLAPHFKDRLSDQNWIIHDTKRNIAAVYNKDEWVITESLPENLPGLSEGEEYFQALWKEYYKRISIEERKNLRQQRGYMPVRYWKNLIEKKL